MSHEIEKNNARLREMKTRFLYLATLHLVQIGQYFQNKKMAWIYMHSGGLLKAEWEVSVENTLSYSEILREFARKDAILVSNFEGIQKEFEHGDKNYFVEKFKHYDILYYCFADVYLYNKDTLIKYGGYKFTSIENYDLLREFLRFSFQLNYGRFAIVPKQQEYDLSLD
jgi:hypothetical protein